MPSLLSLSRAQAVQDESPALEYETGGQIEQNLVDPDPSCLYPAEHWQSEEPILEKEFEGHKEQELDPTTE